MTQTDSRPVVGTNLEKRPTGRIDVEPVDAEIVDRSEGPQPPRKRATIQVLASRPLVGQRSAKELVLTTVARPAVVATVGGASWAKRSWSAATHGYIREQIRLARAAGNQELLGVWIDRLKAEKNERLERLLQIPKLAVSLVVTGAISTGVILFVLLVLGVIVQLVPGGATWVDFWDGVGTAISWASLVVKVLFYGTVAGGFPLLAWLAVREGKRVGGPPTWLLTKDEKAVINAEITPSKVVTAMRDLGIAALRVAIKEMGDAGAAMLSPVSFAGCGVEVDVALPSGVSTDQIQDRRRKLAENLDRHEHELFITIPPKPRTVRLWIANSGALDLPIGPSPLALEEKVSADYYNGKAPWGQTLRGSAAEIAVKQRMLLVTGLSNQGKTAALRALVLWLMFDVTVELRLADLKGIGDWHMFDGLATTLIEGPSDDHVMQATHMLEGGVAEMERRLQAMDPEKYPNGVTRELARQKGSGFHPLVLVVDEAQQAFMCPAAGPDKRPYGGKSDKSRYFMAARKIHNQGRAVNVLLWQGTQDPTDQNLPKLVREGAHIRCSLAVGTESQGRMALGDKAIDGGAAPHLLRQGLDKGTLVVTGDGVDLPPGEASITIRTHFVDGEDATSVAKRAKEMRARRGRHLAVVSTETPSVDHLANVSAALGDESRLRTPVLLGKLIELDEDTYTPWGFQDLKAAMADEGVPVATYRGNSVVHRKDVEKALQERLVESS